MTEARLPGRERHVLGALVQRYPHVHLGIGLLGNALFVIGSVLFMIRQPDIGLWFFLVGSSGMLVGTLGEVMRKLGRRRLVRFDIDPARPDHNWSEPGGTEWWEK